MGNSGIIIAFVAVIVLIALAVVLSRQTAPGAVTTVQTPTSQATSLMAIRLTDPPTVPAGTSALVISYSKIGVHLSNAGNSSGWVYSNASGRINLLSILNVSSTIGAVALPLNASIEEIRFNISSADMTVNGTVYNVTVPSMTVTAHFSGRTDINATSSSILLSLSPTIVSIITNSSCRLM